MKISIYVPDDIGEKLTTEQQENRISISKIVTDALRNHYGMEEIVDASIDYHTALEEVKDELDIFVRENPGKTFTVADFESFKCLTPAIKAAVGRKMSYIIRTEYNKQISVMFNDEDGTVMKSSTNATIYQVNEH